MSSLTKKEFAKQCGLTTRELSVYISREKVILTRNKIDDTLPENVEFMESKKGKGLVKKLDIILKPPMTKEEQKVIEARLKEQDKRSKLNTNIKERDLEKVNEEIELLKIKRLKLEGLVIPLEPIRNLMSQEFKQFVISFQQGADILIMEISKKKS